MLALALEVQRFGAHVALVTLPGLEDWLRPYGIPFVVAGRSARAILVEPNVFRVMQALREDLSICARAVYEQSGDAETLVTTAVFPAAASICEARHLRHVYLAVGPHVIDSEVYPVSGLPYFGLPRFLNKLSWRANAVLWEAAFGGPLQQLRRELGLAPQRGAWEQHRGSNVIVASDPLFGTISAPEGRRVTFTGALTLSDPENLPSALDAFLNTGAPPVFFGFGSMPSSRAAGGTSATRIFVSAAKALGRRAVILSGSESEAAHDPEIYFTGPVDFDRLLRRCAAIVHHGGAGTTHAALRAGIPQVIVPHLLDQFGWAHLVARASLGPPAIPYARLNGQTLATALQLALSEKHVATARQAAGSARVGNAHAAEVLLGG